MKKLVIILAVMIAIIWGGWLIAIPSKVLVGMAEDAAKRGGMEIQVDDFRKGLFYNFTVSSIKLVADGRTMLQTGQAEGRLDLPSLLTLKARVPFKAELASGHVEGKAVFRRKGYDISASAEGIDLEEIGLRDLLGVGMKGTLRGDGNLTDGFGKVRFIVNGARIDPVTVQGMQLPLDMFTEIKGAIHVDGPKVDIDSIAFEGDGLYARVTGSVKDDRANVKLDFMPEERAIPDSILKGVIPQYRVGRGHYVIPYNGPLSGAL
jgi:type II secretion system protein N